MEFSWPVRVYYEDTDSGGVVYYANYLKFMERARSEWLRALGFEQDVLWQQQGIVFAVRRAEVDFRSPARFNDALTVVSRVAELRRASLTFHQEILRTEEGRLLVSGEIQVVCVDRKRFRPVAFPENITERVANAE
ncbi:MAG: tol-pal system-associated acyl-CoA thioesterase [Gammaproteobacteria bacterium]|nr:tol-pal system-associated acyl-CoA thioesterase [Gammaproteobacteria bacterium]